MSAATTYRDLLPVLVETTGAVLPEGYDSWGIKSVHPDLVTTRGFVWAPPGGTSISADHLDPSNADACPSRPGDGLCVATTWQGMASGGIPARTLILVAYRSADVVGRDDIAGMLRVGGEVASVALVDGERLVREHGACANLRRANLQGADLRRANLRGANLWGVIFWGADLRRANLRGADLRGADLRRANLQDANLQDANLWGVIFWGANLRGANLQGANLQDVDLQYANLRGANLRGADLRRADLRGANLQDANLRRADLQGADLQDVRWTIGTPTPDGWTLTDAGTLTREIAEAQR